MSAGLNPWLFGGGVASAAAAVAHLLCIAGERMARAVERGELRPHLVTLAIAAVLAGWAAYALSGAGATGRLPLLRPVVTAITAIYLLRAMAMPVMLRLIPDRSPRFLIVSSLVVLAIGVLHLIGISAGIR